MGCNCGPKAPAVNYVYRDGSGNSTTYRTEIEARAAQIRNGGVGTITQVPR